MKNIQKVLGDTSPKNTKKLTKSLNRGEGVSHLNALQAEINSYSTKNYDLIGCLLTENYFVDYGQSNRLLKSSLNIIPISEIKEIYRTNLTPDFKDNWDYNFYSFFLAIHSNDRFRGLYCQSGRSRTKNKKIFEQYQEVVKRIRGNINTFTGGEAC
ncbi:MAG: hypothetical protein HUJ70_01815 [Pseudobutyrivibrio sp.]|nr:hypothetical protein [Pseudobutyrivibrio sp.]